MLELRQGAHRMPLPGSGACAAAAEGREAGHGKGDGVAEAAEAAGGRRARAERTSRRGYTQEFYWQPEGEAGEGEGYEQ